MADTSLSLLERLRGRGQAEDWERLFSLYNPLIYHWLNRFSLQASDADDLAQEVRLILMRELPRFQYDAMRQGGFRSWVRKIVANQLRAFCRQRRPLLFGQQETDFKHFLEQLADPRSDLGDVLDREDKQVLVRRVLELIQPEFQRSTWTAFQKYVLDGADPISVARDLGVSRSAVYVAKTRILARLRTELNGILEPPPDFS